MEFLIHWYQNWRNWWWVSNKIVRLKKRSQNWWQTFDKLPSSKYRIERRGIERKGNFIIDVRCYKLFHCTVEPMVTLYYQSYSTSNLNFDNSILFYLANFLFYSILYFLFCILFYLAVQFSIMLNSVFYSIMYSILFYFILLAILFYSILFSILSILSCKLPNFVNIFLHR